MAPAAAFATVGVTWTARWRGRTTPVTPAPSAERRSAPRLPGSVTPSTATRNGGRFADPAGEVVELGLREGRGLGQHALGRLAAGLGVEALAADLLHGHAQVGGEVDDVGRAAVTVLGGDPQLPHLAPAGQQQLPDGLASLDLLAAQAPRRCGPPRRWRAAAPPAPTATAARRRRRRARRRRPTRAAAAAAVSGGASGPWGRTVPERGPARRLRPAVHLSADRALRGRQRGHERSREGVIPR